MRTADSTCLKMVCGSTWGRSQSSDSMEEWAAGHHCDVGVPRQEIPKFDNSARGGDHRKTISRSPSLSHTHALSLSFSHSLSLHQAHLRAHNGHYPTDCVRVCVCLSVCLSMCLHMCVRLCVCGRGRGLYVHVQSGRKTHHCYSRVDTCQDY